MIGKLSIRVKPIRFLRWLKKSCRRPIRYKGRCIGFIREENYEIFEWNEKKQVYMSKRRV